MRTRVTLALAAAAALVGTTLPAAQAGPESPVPADSGVVATGNGWGHGRGMSQWGAQARAAAGIGYLDILRFYYPGTTFARQSATLRVLISADADRNVVVHARPGLKVRDLGRARTFTLPARPNLWRLVTVAGKTRVQYKADGRWRPYRTAGRVAFTGVGQFSAPGAISLWVGGEYKAYRGVLRYVGGRTVNVLNLETYLRGVVPAEAPGSWPANALRAQAVAARTYALYKKAHASGSYDLCDTSACQVYKGVAAEWPAATAAVQATAGLVVRYAGALALTEFSASNGGWTAASSLPYQVAKQDMYDVTKYRDWTVTVTPSALQQQYPSLGTPVSFTVKTRDPGGRVLTMTYTGTGGSRDLTGDQFRIKFGLRSTMFTLAPQS